MSPHPARLLALLLVALLAAPAAAAASDASGSATEASSGRVCVAALLPFVADALRRYPDRVELVASVRRSLDAPVADGVADLGSPHEPNLEQLAAARPELVVGDAQLHARKRAALERSGAELLLLDTASVASTFDALRALGERAGVGEALEAEVEAAREAIDALALEEPTSVLPLFGAPGSFYAVSERAWLGDLLARLGFENVVPETGERGPAPGFVPLADEAMATLRPELVLLVVHGDPERIRAAFLRRTRQGGPWSGVRESARGVHALEPALFGSNPGLALPKAARRLVDLAREGDAAGETAAGPAAAEGPTAAADAPPPEGAE